MTNINGVNKTGFPHELKHNKKTGQDDGTKSNATKEAAPALTNQTNKLIIEMHLKIRSESSINIRTQAGINMHRDHAGIDLSSLQYKGKPVTGLSQDEASELVSEGGFFSIEQTAQRIYDFAFSMAGDDPERLQAARNAVLKGFKEAESLFGGQLPEISHKTIETVLQLIDEKITGLGGSVINVKA